MADTSIFDNMQPSDGSVALAHERLIRLKQAGSFINITGDVNNLALNPSPVTTQREVYGTKGSQSQNVLAHNFAPSFNVEVVRDPNTKQIVAAQAWVIDLVNAAFSTGADNKRDFQIFTDALDENMPVFEGTFSVTMAEANTGYADKGVLTFTLTNDGTVDRVEPSPLAGTGEPIIESIGPAEQAAGEIVVIRGYKLTGTTGVTIGGTPSPMFQVVDDYTVVAEIPTGATGTVPVIVTNATGPSTAVNYVVA